MRSKYSLRQAISVYGKARVRLPCNLLLILFLVLDWCCVSFCRFNLVNQFNSIVSNSNTINNNSKNNNNNKRYNNNNNNNNNNNTNNNNNNGDNDDTSYIIFQVLPVGLFSNLFTTNARFGD